MFSESLILCKSRSDRRMPMAGKLKQEEKNKAEKKTEQSNYLHYKDKKNMNYN